MQKEVNKMNIDKYIKALDNLLGVDHAYYYGDEDVDTLVEIIVAAKNLAEENAKLRVQLEPFKVKRCFTCLHYDANQDFMPCCECEDHNKYEWLGGKQ